MRKQNFDIYDYVHNNDFTLKVVRPKNVSKVSKPYNDIRKTSMNEVKIKDGKFSLKESLEGDKPEMSNDDKRRFLEIISTYNKYQDQMKRQSDMSEIADTLGAIVDAAKELTTSSAGDWFDAVTIKRNMGELDKLDTQFQKFAADAKLMDERLHALYEDMGHILNRYYDIADIDENVMKSRLAMKTEDSTHAFDKNGQKRKVFVPTKKQDEAVSYNNPLEGAYVKYYEVENGKKYPWYIEYIDSTHVAMSMKDPNERSGSNAAVYHIGQLRDKKFYNAMIHWMQTGDAKGIMNKSFNESISKFKTLMLK